MDTLEQARQHKTDTRYGTWNVRNLYRAGSLTTVVSKLTKYNFDLEAVQEVRWFEAVVSQQMIIHFSMEMGMLIIT
jgi:hypothetical protein